MSTAPDLEASLGRLQEWFATVPAAAVALSGGVDSSLVAFLAQRLLGGERATACVAVSASLKSTDLDQARRFCRHHGIALEEIETGEVDDANYASNPVDRCFFCKSILYSAMAATLPADREVWILNGTNLDDLGDWRPGLKAADRARVRSPLSECGVDKEGVRALARRFDLDCWDRPASPCLASRVPYGQPVTRDKLRRIEAGENVLQQLGFPVVRVRHVARRARIEVPTDRLQEITAHRSEIERRLTDLGFAGVDIDAEGFVSGKLNRSIPT